MIGTRSPVNEGQEHSLVRSNKIQAELLPVVSTHLETLFPKSLRHSPLSSPPPKKKNLLYLKHFCPTTLSYTLLKIANNAKRCLAFLALFFKKSFVAGYNYIF